MTLELLCNAMLCSILSLEVAISIYNSKLAVFFLKFVIFPMPFDSLEPSSVSPDGVSFCVSVFVCVRTLNKWRRTVVSLMSVSPQPVHHK